MNWFGDISIEGELPKDPCVFAAADNKYFLENGPAFVYSVDDINKPIHIHIINPVSESKELAETLAATTKNTLTFSYHTSNVPSTQEAKSTLFACVRFLVLPEILLSCKRVMVLDIDCMVMKHFDFPENSIGYFPRDYETRKETKVAAGVLYFDASAINVVQDIKEEIKNVSLKWYDDQIALNTVLSKIPRTKITAFDQKFMDWDFIKDTTIWTGKGNRKYRNKKYLAKKKQIVNNKMKKL